MEWIRNHKKASIITLVILMILLVGSTTYSRYLYNVIENYILETKGFYFNSSVLSINNKSYKINNWDGVNSYTLTIDLNNRKNSLVSTESDISYEAYVTCSEGVTCTLSKTESILYQSQGTDSYQITILPTKQFKEGDEIEVNTHVISTHPYKKTLSATYKIGVETSKFTYNIEDTINNNYLILNLTNSITFYEVETAFGDYSAGDHISLEDYGTLTTEEKENCYSAKITLKFDPNKYLLDMTANAYLKRLSGSEKTEVINNFNYINEFTFKIDATSSEKILFYKQNKKEDNTYPIVNEQSAIEVIPVPAT